jgi:short-subunit dehydrogenase
MKTALITGSTSGIGLEIARDLLLNNYKVIINGRSKENIEKAISTFPLTYVEHLNYETWHADLSHIMSLYSLKNLEIKELDVLILNAGTTDRSKFKDTELWNWNKVLNTNLTIPFFLVQTLGPYIKKNGRIIFISSVLAEKPHSSSISYAVSKSGVNTLVKNLFA